MPTPRQVVVCLSLALCSLAGCKSKGSSKPDVKLVNQEAIDTSDIPMGPPLEGAAKLDSTAKPAIP